MDGARLSTGLLLAIVVVGCAEPEIALSVRMPDAARGGDHDTSCLTAIEVYALGDNFENQPTDITRDCIELDTAPATYDDVYRAMKGQFTLPIPPSGLGFIEVLGLIDGCGARDPQDYLPDLVFYGSAEYEGSEQLTIPLGAVTSCSTQTVTVRPLDIVALARDPANCLAAALPDGPDAYVDIGALASTMHGPLWFGDTTEGKLAGGTASMTARMTTTSDACVGINAYSGELDTTTCAITNESLCGGSTDVEVATMPFATWDTLIDPVRAAKWDTAIVGAVWTSGAAKAPVRGATVEIDAALGEVDYVEPGPPATRNLSSTGATGLFVVYTDSIVDVTVSGAGVTRSVKLGTSLGYDNNISLVVMK